MTAVLGHVRLEQVAIGFSALILDGALLLLLVTGHAQIDGELVERGGLCHGRSPFAWVRSSRSCSTISRSSRSRACSSRRVLTSPIRRMHLSAVSSHSP